MNSDKICSSGIPMAASASHKDLAKKKRANRSAKLKQCKLDARREQWLSQVKNKACKDETDANGGFTKPMKKEIEVSTRKLDIKPNDHHYSDSDSPSNSPDSRTSSMSGTNFTSSSRGSGSSSSGGSCNGSIIGEDEEEGNDGCLDDWEAVADALASSSVPLPGIEIENNSKPIPVTATALLPPPVTQQNNSRAWKPDDAFRPHSLPSFSKQLSFPTMNSKRQNHHHHHHHHHNYTNFASSAPSSCPICCEDLDSTDSNFHPCSCGFRLCLFCHKRIIEDDGRCPGCRKVYSYSHDGISSLNIQLGRSCSMIARF